MIRIATFAVILATGILASSANAQTAKASDGFAACRQHEFSMGNERFTSEVASGLLADAGGWPKLFDNLEENLKLQIAAQAELNSGDATVNQRHVARLQREHTEFLNKLGPLVRCVEAHRSL